MSSRGLSGDSEPWVVASWLRDYVLTPRERKDPNLWRKVIFDDLQTPSAFINGAVIHDICEDAAMRNY